MNYPNHQKLSEELNNFQDEDDKPKGIPQLKPINNLSTMNKPTVPVLSQQKPEESVSLKPPVEPAPPKATADDLESNSKTEMVWQNEELEGFKPPNFKRLRVRLALTHPRNEKGQEYGCWESTCLEPGSNLFCATDKKIKEVDKYGPGVTLFFRFVKSSIWMMLWISLINTLLVYMYNVVYSASNNSETTANLSNTSIFLKLRDYGFSSSLGGYSFGSSKFFEANFTNSEVLSSRTNEIISNDSNLITMYCPTGQIDVSRRYTFYGLIEQVLESSYTFYMYDVSCNKDSGFSEAVKHCQDKTKCELPYTSSWFDKACLDSRIYGADGAQKYKLYLKYHCYNIKVGGFGQTFNKSELNFVVLIVSGATFLSYLIYLFSWSVYETTIFKNQKKILPSPSDYALKIKNLPKGLDEEELMHRLFLHFDRFSKQARLPGHSIEDMHVAIDQGVLVYNSYIDSYEQKAKTLIGKMVDNGILKKEECTDLRSLVSYKQNNPAKFQSKENSKFFTSLMKVFRQKQDYTAKRDLSMKSQSRFNSVFMVFSTRMARQRYLEMFKISSYQRCGIRCCKKRDKINAFEDTVLKAQLPTEPVNIIWENLQISPFQKTIRRLFSWLFTLMLIAAPVVFVIYMSFWLKNKETYKLSCNDYSLFDEKKHPGVKQQIIDDYVSPKSEGLLFCYCYASFTDRLFEEFKIGTEERQLCFDAYTSIFKQIAGSIVLASILSIMALVINAFIRLLAAFERHSNFNDMVESRLIKGFVLKFLMTCAITLFINFRLKFGEGVYLGSYDDFTPSWFKNIGFSLGLTLLIQVFTAIALSLTWVLLKRLTRCWDRGCKCSGELTKKKSMIELERIYQGEEFDIDLSYIDIINVIFVCLLLCPLIPFILYIGLLNLVGFYLKNKIAFLTYYKKAAHFDEGVSQMARSILQWAIPLHLMICIWVFGNLNVLDEPNIEFTQLAQQALDNQTEGNRFFSAFVTFFKRISNGNAIYFTAALALYLLIVVLRFIFGSFLFRTFKLCLKCCCKPKAKTLYIRSTEAEDQFTCRVPVYLMREEQLLHKLDTDPKKPRFKKPELNELLAKRLTKYSKLLEEPSRKTLQGYRQFTTLASYDYRLHPSLNKFLID